MAMQRGASHQIASVRISASILDSYSEILSSLIESSDTWLRRSKKLRPISWCTRDDRDVRCALLLEFLGLLRNDPLGLAQLGQQRRALVLL